MLPTLARGLRIQISMSLPFNNFIYIFQMIELLRELESARASLFPLVRIHHKYIFGISFFDRLKSVRRGWRVRSVLGFQTWSEHRIPHFFPNCFLVLRRVEKEISWGQLKSVCLSRSKLSSSSSSVLAALDHFSSSDEERKEEDEWLLMKITRLNIDNILALAITIFPLMFNVKSLSPLRELRCSLEMRFKVVTTRWSRAQTSKRLMKYDTRRRKERWMGRYRSFECHRNESEPPFKVRTSDILFECSRNNVNRTIGREER